MSSVINILPPKQPTQAEINAMARKIVADNAEALRKLSGR